MITTFHVEVGRYNGRKYAYGFKTEEDAARA